MKFRIEFYRTLLADYGEIEIEADSFESAYQKAGELATDEMAGEPTAITWAQGDGIDDVGIAHVVALEDDHA